MSLSTGEYLIQLLEQHQVDYVFGIPGVHTAELYRGLANSTIQHITPRHEQGAGFMADGYSRASGKPGVCLVITGPGLSNASTAMLQARADSIPMLVISGVNSYHNTTKGHLHEMPDQAAFARAVAITTCTIDHPYELAIALQQAFTLFASERPGPVHIEIPLDLMQQEISIESMPVAAQLIQAKPPLLDKLSNAISALNNSHKTVILAGGGSRQAANEVLALAEKLDCPIVLTVNARSAFPAKHPLVISASPSLGSVRRLIEEANVVLAIGTEMGPTDYDMYETGSMPVIKKLINVNVEISQAIYSGIELLAKAEQVVPLLTQKILQQSNEATVPCEQVRSAARAELSPNYQAHLSLLESIGELADNIIYVGDSTQLTYAGNLYFEVGDQGGWFNSSTGFGTLGYALPAAIGAKLGCPQKTVVAMVGDVGLQFCLAELGTLHDLGVPVIVLVWNNRGSGEIRNYMLQNSIVPEGVDITPPDFTAIANAYQIDAVRVSGENEIVRAIQGALAKQSSLLIEVEVIDS